MINYTMSMKEFKELIAQPMYKIEDYERVDYEEFEQLPTYGEIAHIFESLAERLGRIPTQTEYVNEGLAISKAFFVGKAKVNGDRWLPIKKDHSGKVLQWHNFKWEERLCKALKQRFARSYPSIIVEYSTILQIKSSFPEFKVGANDYLDGVLGVDMVIGSEKYNKLLYVHVTSASAYSRHWLEKKESRKGRAKSEDGQLHSYPRNFKKGHVHLSFARHEEDATTEFINGIPILKETHIQSVLEIAFLQAPYMDTFKDKQQLVELHNWLIENKIDSEGLGSVWL